MFIVDRPAIAQVAVVGIKDTPLAPTRGTCVHVQ